MGGNQIKCTVATLNYSGIYLSPFQYYEADNWQQLEKIGIIFEQHLKAQYPDLANPCKGIKFDWEIGAIDQFIHKQRYSPLYTSDKKIKVSKFAGVSFKKGRVTLMTKEQFFNEWDQTFNSLKNQQQAKKQQQGKKQYKQQTKMAQIKLQIKQIKQYLNECIYQQIDQQIKKQLNTQQAKKKSKQAQDKHRYQCRMLDFLCYKSIITYLILYNTNKQSNQLYINYRKNNITQNFETITHDKYSDKHKQIVQAYRNFMYTYFQRINIESKINLTMKQFFGSKGPEVMVFVDATHGLKEKIIEKSDNYFIFGPAQDKLQQTLLLVKKSLPFSLVQKFEQDLLYNEKENELQNDKKKDIEKQIQKKPIQKKPNIQVDNHLTNQLKQQDKSKTTPDALKKRLQKQLKPYMNQLYNFFTSQQKNHFKLKESQINDAKKYFKELNQKGIMSWTTDIIFALFQQREDKGKVMFGGFHLASKSIKNCIQVQIIGLIIYLLLKNNFKIVFAGNFNSYLSLKKGDNYHGMFEFVMEKFSNQQNNQLKDNSIINQINIFPKHSKIITTKKKRTVMQAQAKKANIVIEKCIDQIVTNYKFKKNLSHVCEIGHIGTAKFETQNFLPNLQHPYDNFLVQATLDLQPKPS